MRTVILSIFLIFSAISHCGFAEGTYQGSLIKQPNPPKKEDDKGHRKPTCPIICTIDEVNGITPKFIADTFTYYEIWDENFEYCYFATDSECEFLKEFFSLNYEIIAVKYYSDEYVYTGIIYH